MPPTSTRTKPARCSTRSSAAPRSSRSNLGPSRFVTAVLLAGGTGDRFGGPTPKQFAHLAGEPLFVHPLRVLVSSLLIDAVIVVLPPLRDAALDEFARLPKVCSITRGGPSRQASLARGLGRLPTETNVVLVHDAARPLLTEEVVSGVLEALDGPYEGAISAVPLEDSLKRASDGQIAETVERESVWRAQTPQVFRRPALEHSLAEAEQAGVVGTDCSELLTRAGYAVRLVEGDPLNIKLTRAEDLELAELIFQIRAGSFPDDMPKL